MGRPSIEDEICTQHVLEAGFLWLLRDQAVRDAAYDLTRLSALDERVEANLDGLRLAGDRGWKHASAALKNGEAGEMFVAALLAVFRNDIEGLAAVLDSTGGDASLLRGVASALGWSSLEEVHEILPGLFDVHSPAELHWLGIAACAAHREDPGPEIGLAAGSDDLRLRARAFRAAGQLGRLDLLPVLVADLGAADVDLSFAAAWSGTLLGNPDAAVALGGIAKSAGSRAEDAADLAARALEHDASTRMIQDLARAPATARSAIRGAMALGSTAFVPWLLECTRDDDLARPAAWAVTTILGVDLVAHRGRRPAPFGVRTGPSDAAGDSNVAADADESLEWPNPDVLKSIWESEQRKLRRGTRYLLGQELTPERLRHALRHGVQPIRRGAALEIAVQSPGRPLTVTSAPAFRMSTSRDS